MSMRIQGQKATESGIVQVRDTSSRSAGEVENSAFRRTLTDLSQDMHAARLAEMREDINRQGERLSDRVDVKEFEKYRRLIREFLDEIVSNGYTFSKEDAYGSRGRHRYIATVKVINEKLDELGKEVMKDQADKIDIIHKIDDIRGLLLDVMM
ncbi:MAG: YaaR family protein [Oscillospiraceae bacterium]|nr:YaaR family protein [Oscillospiraceae bacterium]